MRGAAGNGGSYRDHRRGGNTSIAGEAISAGASEPVPFTTTEEGHEYLCELRVRCGVGACPISPRLSLTLVDRRRMRLALVGGGRIAEVV